MLDAARWMFRKAQTLCSRMGLDVRYVGRAPAGIPDADLYKPYLAPWTAPEMKAVLETSDVTSLVTPDRKYVLWAALTQAVRTTPGDVIECGVYRGGTAHMFAGILKHLNSQKALHLFDTFAGMPETNAQYDIHGAGDFKDTSLAAVQQYLADFTRIQYHQGFIPDTFKGLDSLQICFAHIDLDIYDAIYAATTFVYDRLPRGGVIVYDDYGLPSCPGARAAVDAFFKDKPEIPLVLQTGQCFINKA